MEHVPPCAIRKRVNRASRQGGSILFPEPFAKVAYLRGDYAIFSFFPDVFFSVWHGVTIAGCPGGTTGG